MRHPNRKFGCDLAGSIFLPERNAPIMMKIAVILPVYNESECIEQTFDQVLKFSSQNPAYNFIFVNDGSTDNTQEILEKKLKASATPNIKLISYQQRRGKGYAVKKGGESIEADYICFMDSDLAYSLEHLEPLVATLETVDVVIGCRNLDKNNFRNLTLIRKLLGKVFNFMSRKILNLKYKDMQAGLKGFRKEAAKELFKNQSISGFSFDVELIFISTKKGLQIGEIPARVSEKHIYKVSKVNLVKDSLKMFTCLLKIRYNDLRGRYD